MKRNIHSWVSAGGFGPCPRGGTDDVLPQAALQQSLLKGMAAGAGAGFSAALLFLAAAEGLGVYYTGFTSGLIAFGISGWCGVGTYLILLFRRFLTD